MFYWLIMCDAPTQLTLHRARTRELPGHVPFVVNQEYINSVTKECMGPIEALFRYVYATLVILFHGCPYRMVLDSHPALLGLQLIH